MLFRDPARGIKKTFTGQRYFIVFGARETSLESLIQVALFAPPPETIPFDVKRQKQAVFHWFLTPGTL